MNFVFDIDGTICFDGKRIEEDIQKGIDRLIAAGHEVIFASARPIRDLLPVLPKRFHSFRLIGGNGAYTSFNGNRESVFFDQQTKLALLHFIEKYNCTYLADSEWDFSYTGDVKHPIYKNINTDGAKNLKIEHLQNLCKLVLFDVDKELLEKLAALPIVLTNYKSEDIYDISPLGINKVSGIEQLNIDEFIAFGNDQNDRCLFERAVYSVCVGEQEVKALANENILKEEVAKTIEKLSTIPHFELT